VVRPSVECLESREVLASVFLTNGLLSVIGESQGSVIQVSSQGTNIRVLADGKISLFPSTSVTSLTLIGGTFGKNDITNLTSFPSLILGGNAGDTLQAFGGNDRIICGTGSDVVYDILGTNLVDSSAGTSKDTLFVASSNVTVNKANDQVVSFFAPGRTPGAGTVQQVNGVIYITPPDGGSVTTVNRLGNSISVRTSFGNFTFQSADFIGYFGGNGDDVYINNMVIPEVAYGGLGGNDTMIGSVGNFSFMKGGGGNDTLIGRSLWNDISGNGGTDILVSMRGTTVFRKDADDVFFPLKKGDRVIL